MEKFEEYLVRRIDKNKKLSEKGVSFETLTLNIGLGTFSPLRNDVVEENNSIRVIAELLKDKLPHLDEQMFKNRYITVVRFLGLSLANHSKEKNAFRGPNADFFISNVLDLLAGLFTAEVSDETRRNFDGSN